MALDVSKLENVKTEASGKIQARCPACAAVGADGNGDHLAIFPDGAYSCAANQNDAKHSKEIFKLAGLAGGTFGRGGEKVSVNRFKVPDSTVIMDLALFERFTKKADRRKTVEVITDPYPESHRDDKHVDDAPARNELDVTSYPPHQWSEESECRPPDQCSSRWGGHCFSHSAIDEEC